MMMRMTITRKTLGGFFEQYYNESRGNQADSFRQIHDNERGRIKNADVSAEMLHEFQRQEFIDFSSREHNEFFD
jgi:hypothetical protein